MSYFVTGDGTVAVMKEDYEKARDIDKCANFELFDVSYGYGKKSDDSHYVFALEYVDDWNYDDDEFKECIESMNPVDVDFDLTDDFGEKWKYTYTPETGWVEWLPKITWVRKEK